MQKPVSLSEFKKVIDGMQHRERFVFPVDKKIVKSDLDRCVAIEVYNTILWESKNLDRNITVYLVDSEGNPLQKKARLHRLWNEDFYQKVYVMIGADPNESKLIHESSEILELPG
jgi:hypothetical protein